MSEPTTDSIRVVVVDDHQIVRDGLVALLGALDGIEVVGTAADGREALHVVQDSAPDLVVMDIQMPHLDGIEATRFLTGRTPALRVVMLTMNEDDDTILAAIRAGACGYLLKGAGAAEVQHAIRAAAAGGMVFGASLAARVAAGIGDDWGQGCRGKLRRGRGHGAVRGAGFAEGWRGDDWRWSGVRSPKVRSC